MEIFSGFLIMRGTIGDNASHFIVERRKGKGIQ